MIATRERRRIEPEFERQGVIFADLGGAEGFTLLVPRGVQLERPVEAPSLKGADSSRGRALVVVEEGASLHFVAGCLSPTAGGRAALPHATEVRAMKGARVRVTTLENRSRGAAPSIKRAVAHEGAAVEWVDAGFGLEASEPVVVLAGPGARADILCAAFSGQGRSGVMLSKSVTGDGTSARRDVLSLDQIGAERLFYLMCRGLDRSAAMALAVNGFFEPFTKELPLEYAVEFNRLIELELEGAPYGL